MIRESVRAFDRWNVSARQRITHFEIVLASGDLAGMPPGRRGIVTERVVHPFPNFMSRICRGILPWSALPTGSRPSAFFAIYCSMMVIAEALSTVAW